MVSKWGTPVGCVCRFELLNHIHMHSFRKGPSGACRQQIVQIGCVVCYAGPTAGVEVCNQKALSTTVG